MNAECHSASMREPSLYMILSPLSQQERKREPAASGAAGRHLVAADSHSLDLRPSAFAAAQHLPAYLSELVMSTSEPSNPPVAAPSEASVLRLFVRVRPFARDQTRLTLLWRVLVRDFSRLRAEARKAKIQARGGERLARLANTARGEEGAKLYDTSQSCPLRTSPTDTWYSTRVVLNRGDQRRTGPDDLPASGAGQLSPRRSAGISARRHLAPGRGPTIHQI